MSLKQHLFYTAAAVACLVQASCETGGPPVDLKYPSVSELDSADVRWGLPARKGKGAPKRVYQYQVDEHGGSSAAAAPVASAPPPSSAPSAPAEPIPAKPDPQNIDVNKLR
ncbi:MAG: hypothetical protein K1X78_12810 [Verrucomicrobiaceae bacterium]|nr:hypothetical protein [Verrucomicrobiaceae bacterium]